MKLPDETQTLLDAFLAGCATPEQEAELDRRLAADAELRAAFCDAVETEVLLSTWVAGRQEEQTAESVLREMGSESSLTRSGSEEVGVQPLGCPVEKQAKAWTPTRRASEGLEPAAPQGDSPIFAQQKLGQSPFRIFAIAVVVAFIAIGILAYTFWAGPAALPVVKQTPAAKIANLTDAKWAGATSQAGDTLNAGQQLLLQSGSAEITFNSQARVIVDGPAEFTIVDATACRLSTGKLTAHVPAPAKGFQVHTPSGTVTDLGTEFGVYVDTHAEQQASREEEQQPGGGPQFEGKQPPITEVHVFKGRVDVAPGDQLAQAAGENPPPKSEIRNQKSKILSAGEAVTISENKVQPLPAADPFKFALDKLQGKPRQVLLSEDFESYDFGVKRDAMGAWIIQGSIRKGQSVAIGDYDKAQADWTAQHGLADPSLNPPPPSISRLLVFAPSEPNPRSEFPRVARPIEAPQLAHTCRVLMEFVIFPSGKVFEPSFALAGEAGLAPGIEFWRNADPAAPSISWKPNLVYRVRVLMDVAEGKLRGARVERSQWSGSAGWVRDADFRTPVPTVDWTTPPKFVIFGYPTVTPQTPATPYNIDNIRIEVISEK